LAVPIFAAERDSLPADFTSESAMAALFGNYDRVTKTSSTTIPSDSKLSEWDFQPGAEIAAKSFFTQATTEAGITKVFLLTYAIPKTKSADGDMYHCHACAPLIGAALFSQKGGNWIVENFNASVMIYGQFGEPPEAELIKIGRNRVGVKLNMTYGGQGAYTTTAAILVPWHRSFTEAFWTTLSDRYEDCNFSKLPCYKYTKQMQFVAGKNPDYFDIILKSSGTEIEHSEPPKVIPVSKIERLQFLDGKYVPSLGGKGADD
jgi:hypothetical protein